MKRKFIIVFAVLVLILLIVGLTFALAQTNLFTQNVSFTIDGGITITYDAGNDISGVKLIPVTTLQKGLNDGTAIEKTITVSSNKTSYFNLYMDVEILDNGLKRDYVVYQLKKGNDVVASGNFANASVDSTINLLSDEAIIFG